MHMVPESIADNLPLVVVFLLVVVFFRAQGSYWLGRAAAAGALWGKDAGGLRGAIGSWFDGPIPRSGVRILERWGLIIIPLCFLTVGIQTAVNAGAGMVRLPWVKYTLLMLPGCVAWALMYGLGLAALWAAGFAALAGSPWAWGVIAVVVVATIAMMALFRRHRGVLDEEDATPAAA